MEEKRMKRPLNKIEEKLFKKACIWRQLCNDWKPIENYTEGVNRDIENMVCLRFPCRIIKVGCRPIKTKNIDEGKEKNLVIIEGNCQLSGNP
jgi:hypothetical protein